MKNSIIVKIRGGLGNQLFQYAYAKKVQKLFPTKKIIIDASYFNKKHIRSLELNQLKINEAVSFSTNKRGIFDLCYDVFRLIDKISKHKRKTLQLTLLNSTYCLCEKTGSFKWKKNSNNNIYLAGYFQDLKEMDAVKKDIKTEVCPKSLSDKAKSYLDIISNNETIAISIRAGEDYVKFGWPLCSKEYYLKGLEYIKKDHAKIIVFADVIDKIKKEKWFDNYEVTYIEGCNAVESLYLLNRCDDYVISNSTFSWWGAYLGDNNNKKIVAPEMFYSGKKMSDGGLHIPSALYMNNYTGKPCK